jgi:hypothetical protein
MTDAEIRGRLLTQVHALRHSNGGWVPISDINLAPVPVELRVIGGVCQQLADIGLIQWRPLQDSTGFVAGTGKITGQGVAAVESGRSGSIDIQLPSKDTARPDKTDSFPLVAAAVTGMPAAESSVIDVPAIMAATATSIMAAQRELGIAPPPPVGSRTEILTLKPTFMGMSIDLKEVGRRVWPWVKRRFGSKA